MFATLALSAAEQVVNQAIDLDAATRHSLNQLAGKVLRIVIDTPYLSVDVLFDLERVRLSPTPVGMDAQPAHSLFEQRIYDTQKSPAVANLTLHVPHLVALVSLLMATPGTTGNLSVQGELGILQHLQQCMAQAEPDLTAKLAPWIGDTLAHQLAQRVSAGQQLLRQTGSRVLELTEQQLKQDHSLLAPRWQAERFIDGVRDLRNDIERLQARMQQWPDEAAPRNAAPDPAVPNTATHDQATAPQPQS